MRAKYTIPAKEADRLIESVAYEILRKVADSEGIPIDQQHHRLDDVMSAIKDPSGFKKPISTLKVAKVQQIAETAQKQIRKTAACLAEGVTDEPSLREIAAFEFRQQLRSALLAHLTVVKAKDSMQKWAKARKVAVGAAVGAAAIGAIACLIVRELKRGENPEQALARGRRKDAESERKRKQQEGA